MQRGPRAPTPRPCQAVWLVLGAASSAPPSRDGLALRAIPLAHPDPRYSEPTCELPCAHPTWPRVEDFRAEVLRKTEVSRGTGLSRGTEVSRRTEVSRGRKEQSASGCQALLPRAQPQDVCGGGDKSPAACCFQQNPGSLWVSSGLSRLGRARWGSGAVCPQVLAEHESDSCGQSWGPMQRAVLPQGFASRWEKAPQM